MILFWILLAILFSRRGRRAPSARLWGGGPWSGWNSGIGPFGGGGGFGGGFGGFGGGGGGWRRRWVRRLRRRPQRRRRRLGGW